MATNGPIYMIEHAKWIDGTKWISFLIRIISIGPLFGEIGMATAKTCTKRVPGKERVNKCFDLVMRKVNKYFGTYLGYLPTIPTSQQCDKFQLIPVSF